MFAPSATPKEIQARLNAEMVKAINMPDTQEQLRSRAMTPAPMTQEQFAAFWKAEREKFAAAVAKANIQLD
jgi:tripartite-type tricarboxylate transporter receptor subunit TctC